MLGLTPIELIEVLNDKKDTTKHFDDGFYFIFKKNVKYGYITIHCSSTKIEPTTEFYISTEYKEGIIEILNYLDSIRKYFNPVIWNDILLNPNIKSFKFGNKEVIVDRNNKDLIIFILPENNDLDKQDYLFIRKDGSYENNSIIKILEFLITHRKGMIYE